MLHLVPVALVLAAPPAAADCALSLDAITGALDHHAPGVKTVQPPRRDGRLLTETIAFADGVRVTFEIGGCAHFAYAFTYDVGRAIPSDPDGRLGLARSLLERTPARDGLARTLAEAVRKRLAAGGGSGGGGADGSIALPCGDAQCAIEVITGSGKAPRLRVQYDLAL